MMLKTRALILAVVLVCGAASIVEAKGRGWAVGGEGSLYLAGNGGLPMSAMFVFHVPQLPLMFGVGINTTPALGATLDYWAARGHLASIFDWYLGVGGYLTVDFASPASISAGGRIPIGLQAWPVEQVLEIFIEIAPAVGVVVVPTAFEWHLQGAVGLRFWF
jgi:hypothetical protein